MTVETETILIKLLEELKTQVKELDQKFEKKFDNLQKDLNELKVTVAEIKVEVVNSKKDIEELKSEIKGRISIQTYWFLGLLTFLVTIVGKFAFFPNP